MPQSTLQATNDLQSLFLSAGTQWLEPVQLSGPTIGSLAQSQETRHSVFKVLETLADDDYLLFLKSYYESGERRFGRHWNYADLLTFLDASARLIQPNNYLEIGVRRGRSMAIVASAFPQCEVYGFDLWMQDYAGMPNPGPDFVEQELKSVGFEGNLELISGDSHQTLREFFAARPELLLDLVNVDGDHSEDGARDDLLQVIPHVALGGVLLMDDITHPLHRYLEKVWDEVLAEDGRFSCYKYTDLGYGVAVAIRTA